MVIQERLKPVLALRVQAARIDIRSNKDAARLPARCPADTTGSA